MKIKKRVLLLLNILLILSFSTKAHATSNIPYDSYNYDYWEQVYYTPSAYIPELTITGLDIGVEKLNNPQDIYVDNSGKIFIADTGNNRIIVINHEFKLLYIIDEFLNGEKMDSFKNPTGLFVTESNVLYIADTDNLRVVALDEDGNLVRIIENPTSEVLSEDFVFAPMKVTVDYADRVYVIAKNMFQGIMAFDELGDFNGFSGTINVTISNYEKIWRRFSTKAQRSRQLQFVPTEFTGVDIDSGGFIYATNIDTKGIQSIRRLNPKGEDVIKKNKEGNLSGDIAWRVVGAEYSGASRIVDITYRGNGVYSVLDYTRGRVFTYDHEGNLLYVFGGRGSQKGTFRNPVAIEGYNDKIFILDGIQGEITVFKETRYAQLINQAVMLRYSGDESEAVSLWREVLNIDSNFELAYVGIGKSYLAAGDNKMAMKYLKLGMNREYYSIAYKRYRDDILKENLSYILTGTLVVVILGRVAFKIYERKRGECEGNDK